MTTTEETYVGPCSLAEALEPNGIAVSVPNGDYVAWNNRHGRVKIRRLNKLSGRGGSVAGSGAWLTEAECRIKSWRPG